MQIILHHGDRELEAARWNAEVAPHLLLREVAAPRDLPYAVPEFFDDGLLLAWELVRDAWGKPIRVNSGVRSERKQLALRKAGYRAAEFSPHVVKFARTAGGLIIHRPCLALDLDTHTPEESRLLAECIRDCAPMARIFWSRYLPHTFVHFDIAPMLRFNQKAWLAPEERELPGAWLLPGDRKSVV